METPSEQSPDRRRPIDFPRAKSSAAAQRRAASAASGISRCVMGMLRSVQATQRLAGRARSVTAGREVEDDWLDRNVLFARQTTGEAELQLRVERGRGSRSCRSDFTGCPPFCPIRKNRATQSPEQIGKTRFVDPTVDERCHVGGPAERPHIPARILRRLLWTTPSAVHHCAQDVDNRPVAPDDIVSRSLVPIDPRSRRGCFTGSKCRRSG